jgi:hypothetical protein
MSRRKPEITCVALQFDDLITISMTSFVDCTEVRLCNIIQREGMSGIKKFLLG